MADPFDYSGVGAAMPESYGANVPISDPLAKALLSTMSLPQRAIEGAAAYQPGSGEIPNQTIAPALETALTMMGGSGAIPAEANTLRMGIKAYHGSPYNFDAFDMSKIGSGEGAQAYGHGLYFAEHEPTAQYYRDAVSATMPPKRGPGGGLVEPEGHMYEVNINADPEHFIDWDKPLSEQSQFVKDAVAKHDASISTQPPSLTQIKDPEIRSIVRRAVKANDGQAQGLELAIDNDRGLYDAAAKHAQRNKVDLDAQDMRAGDYVYQQAKPYIDALHASQNLSGDSLGKLLGVKGADMMQSGPVAARLRDLGIPGVKYLDQGSRLTGEGSRNYVVFNDKIIDIIRKYGIAGLLPAAGAATQTEPQPSDIVNAIRGGNGG